MPDQCVRRERIKAQLRDMKRSAPPVQLNYKKFERAARSMPRASTTWTPTSVVKSVARVKDGLNRLHWVSVRILRVDVPVEIRPLIFDRKLVGLMKPSHHQQSIEEGEKRAAADDTRAPCLWANEDLESGEPDGDAPPVPAEVKALAAKAAQVPDPSLQCSCQACKDAGPATLGQSDAVRPIGVGDVWYKLAERAVSFTERDRFAKAMIGTRGHQVGVAVPGGQGLITLATEALLRENVFRGKFYIQNLT